MARKQAPIIAHVNQHVIKHNAKHGTRLPALTIKHPTEGTFYAYEVEGHARLVDSSAQGRKPLSCGARVWMEYDRDRFEVIGDRCTFTQLRARMVRDRDALGVDPGPLLDTFAMTAFNHHPLKGATTI